MVSDLQFLRAQELLSQFVAIPSLSNPTHPEYRIQALEQAAELAGKSLDDLGFNVRYFRIENSAPFVVAERRIHQEFPSVMLYDHYDVQPLEQDAEEKLYEGDSCKGKRGIVAILTALNMYREAGKELPVNVKILFQGEAEYGSPHMQEFLEVAGERLEARALAVLEEGSHPRVLKERFPHIEVILPATQERAPVTVFRHAINSLAAFLQNVI